MTFFMGEPMSAHGFFETALPVFAIQRRDASLQTLFFME